MWERQASGARCAICSSLGVLLITRPTQYVSGRFSGGYRATIGADFIAKTVPHYSGSEESVTLQIWVSPPIPSLRLHAAHPLYDRTPLVKNASPHSPLHSFAVQMLLSSCSTSIGPQRSTP